MSASTRGKGLRGEQEVAAIFRAAGWEVRRLGGLGDCLVQRLPQAGGAFEAPSYERDERRLHVEVKRQERLQLPIWLRQARTEAPAGVVPLVAFRQSGGTWYGALPLRDLVELLG